MLKKVNNSLQAQAEAEAAAVVVAAVTVIAVVTLLPLSNNFQVFTASKIRFFESI